MFLILLQNLEVEGAPAYIASHQLFFGFVFHSHEFWFFNKGNHTNSIIHCAYQLRHVLQYFLLYVENEYFDIHVIINDFFEKFFNCSLIHLEAERPIATGL